MLVFPSQVLALSNFNEYDYFRSTVHSFSNPTVDSLINKSDGSFNYSIPIQTPKGRGGIEPNLSLSYQSNNRTTENIFGFGWSINIPYIEVLSKTGVHSMYNKDYFFSSISGELASSTSVLYHSKVEIGDFLEYTKSGNSWIVRNKEGLQYSFGSTALSRQDDPNNSSKIYKWILEEIRD